MNATAIKLVIKVWHDDCPEGPCEMDGWKVYSFNRRHSNYRDPDEFNPEGLQAKLGQGLAFPLSYFEHGQCVWSLGNEGPDCRWDSVSHAGFIIWEQDTNDLGPKTVEDRRKDARAFIERYTLWCNGEIYGYTVEAFKVCECCKQDVELSEDEAELDLPSCGGYYADDIPYMVESIKEHIGDDWASYAVTFKEQDGYGVADEVKRLWKGE